MGHNKYECDIDSHVIGCQCAGTAGLPRSLTPEEDHNVAKAMKATSQAEAMMASATYPLGDKRGGSKNPEVWTDVTSETSCNYEVLNIPNEQANRIVRDVLPKVLELYLNKSKDYDGNVMAMFNLGPKACFPDLWRKVGKLKGALWDGKPMVGEQADEILADLVGHVLIILDEMNQAR